jgi:hypothetical protein
LTGTLAMLAALNRWVPKPFGERGFFKFDADKLDPGVAEHTSEF